MPSLQHLFIWLALFINPHGRRLLTLASDLADFPLHSSADLHLEEPSLAAVPEMAENSPEESLLPNEPQQHQGGGGPKFESLRAFTGDGPEDVEVFKEIPENSPHLEELLYRQGGRRSEPSPRTNRMSMPSFGGHVPFKQPPIFDPLDERARYLASLPRQHRQFEKQLLGKSEGQTHECHETRQEVLRTIRDLQFNVSVLEVKLELTRMARYQAEEQHRVMLYDFVECQKRMSVSNYVKNDSLRHMYKLNESVYSLRDESFECKVKKYKLETNVGVLEGRLEESNMQLKSALKKVEESQSKMIKLDMEATSLREELSEKIDERNEAEYQLESLRANLMDLQRNSSDSTAEDGEEAAAQLKSEDSLEALNEELVNQMGLMKSENERLKGLFENETDVLREELHECEQSKTESQNLELDANELCSNGRIDAAYNINSTAVVIFQGEYFWVLTTDEGISQDEPQLINSTFDQGPMKVDAAFRSEELDSVFLFNGVHYWHYKDGELLEGFPKFIAEGFPGVPNNIDAAFIWKETGKVYFFKDDMYWQSEDDDTYKMYGIHARWGGAGWHGGVPLNLDAVFDFDGSTIFAKKDLYYRYNDYIHKIEESVPPYPRLSCTWLFGCPPSSACAKKRRV